MLGTYMVSKYIAWFALVCFLKFLVVYTTTKEFIVCITRNVFEIPLTLLLLIGRGGYTLMVLYMSIP